MCDAQCSPCPPPLNDATAHGQHCQPSTVSKEPYTVVCCNRHSLEVASVTSPALKMYVKLLVKMFKYTFIELCVE